MATSTARRPLPALAFLLVLTVLTAVVWWRVLHRSNTSSPPATNAGSKPVTCASAGAKPLTLPAPRTVTVDVLNGAGRNLLATQVTAQLKSRGFKTGTPGDASSPYGGVAEIEYGKSGKAAATLLSFYLPGSRLLAGSNTGTNLTLILGSGYKALASQTSVNAAVARAKKPC